MRMRVAAAARHERGSEYAAGCRGMETRGPRTSSLTVLHSCLLRDRRFPLTTDPHLSATVEHFAARLEQDRALLAANWLDRLDALLAEVNRRDVFPSSDLLDHIPELIGEIAAYLRAPEEEAIAANSSVVAKAVELGLMRFEQGSSVHELLREYQIFSEILEAFFLREAAALGPDGDVVATVLALSRAQRGVRVLEQRTVDAFVERYSETIERQTQRLRDFSRLISHEIRQPLGVLQVLPRVMPVPPGNEEAARLRETLDRNVVRLGEVASMLERLARVTPRRDHSPNEQRVDLAAVAGDVAGQLRDMADARGVCVEVDPLLPAFVTEADRVELALLNLLGNAVKYADPAKPSRMVRVERDPSVPYPRIRIRDNGIGIPASRLAIIFEQFVRVHAHLDDELGTQGMGLGLSIVRECMDATGGTVAVESVAGQGTTFTLEVARRIRGPPRLSWPSTVAHILLSPC